MTYQSFINKYSESIINDLSKFKGQTVEELYKGLKNSIIAEKRKETLKKKKEKIKAAGLDLSDIREQFEKSIKIAREIMEFDTSKIYNSRRSPEVNIRQIITYLIVNNNNYVYERIGEALNFNHSTIMHSCRVAPDILKYDKDKRLYNLIYNKIYLVQYT
jgi:chromosomal replication initiation ATPase DnaA